MILDTPPTLAELGRRSLARAIREARSHRHRPPSPRRNIYLRLGPTSLIGFRQGVNTGAPRAVTLEAEARKLRIEESYTSTGSLEVVAATLAVEAQYLASRRAAVNLDEALTRRAWAAWVVESDLALVADAVALGYLVYTAPPVELEPVVQAA